MGTFHVSSLLHLYDAIKMESESAAPSTASEQGLIRYYGTTGSKSLGTLYVAIPTGESSYEFKPLIHTINAGSNVTVTPGNPGVVTISATGGGGTGDVTFTKVTIGNSSTNVTAAGICYADVNEDTTQGFVYRAYVQRTGEPVEATITTNSSNSTYITIDFGSREKFAAINSSVNIDVLVGTTTALTSNSTTTAPTPRG